MQRGRSTDTYTSQKRDAQEPNSHHNSHETRVTSSTVLTAHEIRVSVTKSWKGILSDLPLKFPAHKLAQSK